MTRDASLTSINCTSCGAGLDILGGGRVQVHICPYCGSELDAQDDYKVIAQYSDLERPKTPISIGMSGKLLGVDYTVIGTLEQRETWGHKVWTWVDHQIFSPTHGYAWLTWEDGHFVFSRRIRTNKWMTELQVASSEARPTVTLGGETFRYYETSVHRITFAEGEFTWRPKIGDRVTSISAMSGSAMLTFSQSGEEREVERSIYLSRAEVEKAFGITLDGSPVKTHALQPFKAGPDHLFIRNVSAIAAVLCLVMAAVFSGMSGGATLQPTRVGVEQLPITLPMEVPSTHGLTEITLNGDTYNSWAALIVEVEGPDGTPMFEAGRAVEYYTGRDSEGTWSEGNNRASLRFRPEQAGRHLVTLSLEEAQHWTGPGVARSNVPALRTVTVSAESGRSSGFFLVILGLAFGLFALVKVGQRWLHHSRRWSGSDWSDED